MTQVYDIDHDNLDSVVVLNRDVNLKCVYELQKILETCHHIKKNN